MTMQYQQRRTGTEIDRPTRQVTPALEIGNFHSRARHSLFIQRCPSLLEIAGAVDYAGQTTGHDRKQGRYT